MSLLGGLISSGAIAILELFDAQLMPDAVGSLDLLNVCPTGSTGTNTSQAG